MNRTDLYQSNPRRISEFAGRDVVRIANDTVELVSMLGGGRICSFRFLEEQQALSQNALWQAPWETLDRMRTGRQKRRICTALRCQGNS
jgi:hypothetical protein